MSLNRPGYVHLIWIDSEGKAAPVLPWKPGDWNQLAQLPRPVGTVNLPEAADEGWPMTGASGMETLLLLVRDTPLPSDVNLSSLLSDLPRQTMQSGRSLAVVANGQLVLTAQDGTRGPIFFSTMQIDDPVLRTQRLWQDRLGRHFSTIRAVTFAHTGDVPEN